MGAKRKVVSFRMEKAEGVGRMVVVAGGVAAGGAGVRGEG